MNKLFDSFFNVKIFENDYGFWWVAEFDERADNGISEIWQCGNSSTLGGCQGAWESFAKTNEIEDYEYDFSYLKHSINVANRLKANELDSEAIAGVQ